MIASLRIDTFLDEFLSSSTLFNQSVSTHLYSAIFLENYRSKQKALVTMMMQSVILVLVMLLLLSIIATHAAVFMKYDGVDGESKDDGHKKWIDILSIDWGHPSVGGGTGSGLGTDAFHFNITKRIDKATPLLWSQAATCGATGNPRRVRIHFAREIMVNEYSRDKFSTNKNLTYYIIEMENVIITNFAGSGISCNLAPLSSKSNNPNIRFLRTIDIPPGTCGNGAFDSTMETITLQSDTPVSIVYLTYDEAFCCDDDCGNDTVDERYIEKLQLRLKQERADPEASLWPSCIQSVRGTILTKVDDNRKETWRATDLCYEKEDKEACGSTEHF